jgi:Xaa-Pro aminopeptidase
MSNAWSDVRTELDVSSNFTDLVDTPWYSDIHYEGFSVEEYARRHGAARALMAEEGVDALLLPGGQNLYSMGAGVTWATGLIEPRGMLQYAVLPREGEPTLVYPHPGCHIEAARHMVAISDVRDGHHGKYAEVVAGRLRELGLENGTIGVTISDRTGGEYLGQHFHETLVAELPQLRLKFLPDALHRLTRLKSDEELEAMAYAGQLATRGLEAVLARARPGVKEYQLGAAAEHAIVDGGGKQNLIMIGSGSQADPTLVFPNPLPSARELKPGDIVLGEISASYKGFSAKIGQPISIGPPTRRYVDFFADVVVPGFVELRSHLRHGVPLEQVQQAGSIFRKRGAQSRPILMHGLDLLTADPFVMTDKINAAPYERTLEKRMTVNIEITPIDSLGVMGMFLSRSFAITDGDPRELTPYPLDDILVAPES